MKTLTITKTTNKEQIELQKLAIQLSQGQPVTVNNIHDNTGDWDIRQER